MFRTRPVQQVILRNQRAAGDYRYLSAQQSEQGDVLIHGQDFGAGVMQVYGSNEYEWQWTISHANIDMLLAALGKPNGQILKLLKKQFSGDNAAKLLPFLQSQKIPFQAWSRIGD